MFTAKMFNPATGTMTVVLQGKSYIVDPDHQNYHVLLDAYQTNNTESFLENVDVVKVLQQFVQSESNDSGVTVTDYGVFYDGEPVNVVITQHMLDMRKQGFDIQPMVKFLENLYQNPDKNSVEQLYSFLQHKNLPITEDGCFIAYKTVLENYKDKYTGKIDNTPGQVVKMRRNAISNDPSQHCNTGLHVGSLSYAGPGGWYNNSDDKVVLVKINPRDAVSVPSDHNFTKLRVCEYEVLCDYTAPLESAVYTNSSKDYDPYWDQDEEIYVAGGAYSTELLDEDDFDDEDEEFDNEDDDEDFDDGNEEDDWTLEILKLQQDRKISFNPINPEDIQEGQKLYLVLGSGLTAGVFYIDTVTNLDTLVIESESGSFQPINLEDIEVAYYTY